MKRWACTISIKSLGRTGKVNRKKHAQNWSDNLILSKDHYIWYGSFDEIEAKFSPGVKKDGMPRDWKSNSRVFYFLFILKQEIGHALTLQLFIEGMKNSSLFVSERSSRKHASDKIFHVLFKFIIIVESFSLEILT